MVVLHGRPSTAAVRDVKSIPPRAWVHGSRRVERAVLSVPKLRKISVSRQDLEDFRFSKTARIYCAHRVRWPQKKRWNSILIPHLGSGGLPRISRLTAFQQSLTTTYRLILRQVCTSTANSSLAYYCSHPGTTCETWNYQCQSLQEFENCSVSAIGFPYA